MMWKGNMASQPRELLSVGIDVGTTTSQVVFSRLSVRDSARPGMVPRIDVTAKSVCYVGEPLATPLQGPDEIDTEGVAALVSGEFRAAGVEPGHVETGAVIITGETARARNGDAMLDALSDLAGDFVVTVAGPNLEAQIAGRGSGAAAYSAEHFTQVTNIDVGGGTANAAIFRLGEHRSSSGMAVGGRQIQIEQTTGRILHLAPPGAKLAEALGLELAAGRLADLGVLRRFCDVMAELVIDLATGRTSDVGDSLQLTPPLQDAGASKALFLSGGVGACYYDAAAADTLADVTRYGDVGPLLAESLRQSSRLQQLRVIRPSETTRATVLGAATQTVTLSGSTIWAERHLLPLRNLAVVRPDVNGPLTQPDELTTAIQHAVRRWDAEGDGRVAVALDLPSELDFETLQAVVTGVGGYAHASLDPGQPLIVVSERDYAQVLGQTLKGMRPELPLVVIDQVALGEGDFIDIGEPMLGGRVVPLSVKTLVFYRDLPRRNERCS
jgi:ethanolamine utilization protein EutA